MKLLPHSQKLRIKTLRFLALCVLPVPLFIRPYYDETLLGEVMEQAGAILIVACVFGRCWTILHIGGRKNEILVMTGPYSICRNPLYLFSIIGVLGFGLMLQSLIYAALLTSVVFLIFIWTIRKEEAFLRQKFGESYATYSDRTPRIVPTNIKTMNHARSLTINVQVLKRTFLDSILFVLLIPISEVFEILRELKTATTFVLY